MRWKIQDVPFLSASAVLTVPTYNVPVLDSRRMRKGLFCEVLFLLDGFVFVLFDGVALDEVFVFLLDGFALELWDGFAVVLLDGVALEVCKVCVALCLLAEPTVPCIAPLSASDSTSPPPTTHILHMCALSERVDILRAVN